MSSKKAIKIGSINSLLDKKYGKKGTPERTQFDAESFAFYYCELIRTERLEAGLTQQELADKANVKRSFVSSVENGKVDVQLSTFLKLLHTLNIRLSLLPLS